MIIENQKQDLTVFLSLHTHSVSERETVGVSMMMMMMKQLEEKKKKKLCLLFITSCPRFSFLLFRQINKMELVFMCVCVCEFPDKCRFLLRSGSWQRVINLIIRADVH